MSVILDALRKLDREKSFRRKGTANIAVEILSPDLTHAGRRIPIYIVIVAVVAIAAAAVTYGVISGFGLLSKSAPPTVKTASAPSQQLAPASPKPTVPLNLSPPAPVNAPAATQQIPRTSVSPAPVQNVQEEKSHVTPKIQSTAEKKERVESRVPVEVKSPVAPVVEKKQSLDVIPKEVGGPPKKTPSEPNPNLSVAHPAALKISAIAWFEDPSRRFAMINGIMATEGSSIEGIKVVEINPTSVRVLYDGQYFEISMSK